MLHTGVKCQRDFVQRLHNFVRRAHARVLPLQADVQWPLSPVQARARHGSPGPRKYRTHARWPLTSGRGDGSQTNLCQSRPPRTDSDGATDAVKLRSQQSHVRACSRLHYVPLIRRNHDRIYIERTGLHANNGAFSVTFQSADPASVRGKRCSYCAYCLDLPLVPRHITNGT